MVLGAVQTSGKEKVPGPKNLLFNDNSTEKREEDAVIAHCDT